jgi:hypothetical protein
MRKMMFMPYAVAAVSLFSQLQARGEVSNTVAAPPAHDKIDAVNAGFRSMYASSRKDFLHEGGPVLIWRNAVLTLINGDQMTNYNYFPAAFDILKTGDHVGLGVFVALTPNSQHPSAERLQQLADFRQRIIDAQPEWDSAGLSPRALLRQQRIKDRALAFIDKVEAAKGCSELELHDFVQEILPSSTGNVKEAVAADLGAMDIVVKKVHQQLTPEEWSKLHVIVCSVHMARQDESHMQYFLRLLSQQEEGRRVIFFEGSGEIQDAMNLLGTHELDSRIGQVYFGDPERMHHDLLGPAAAEYLDDHPVQ